MNKTLLLFLLLAFAVNAQQQNTFTDPRDGKKYKYVKIGSQTWMAENLNYDAKDSKCYDNESANCDKYGRLYNWNEAMKACPKGWHLPSDKEWQTLIDFASNVPTSGFKKALKKTLMNFAYRVFSILDFDLSDVFTDNFIAAEKLMSRSEWENDSDLIPLPYPIADEYGFSALLGGTGHSDGSFGVVGETAFWWSATERKSSSAHYVYMYKSNTGFDFYFKSSLLSVRCAKDTAPS